MKWIPPTLCCLLIGTVIPCAAQGTDPFAGDQRLLKKQTIKAAGVPLKDLLEYLSRVTGILFVAGPRVAEDKVVLFAHDRPLADSLRIIAKFFNFYWGRTGQPHAYVYTVSQSLRQQQAEEAVVEAAYYRAADQILNEIRLILTHGAKPVEELLPLVEQLKEQIQADKNPLNRGALATEQRIVYGLMRSGYPLVAARFLSRCDREGLVRLMKARRTEYVWPHEAGKEPMPLDLRDEIYRTVDAQNKRNNVTVSDFNFALLRIEGGAGLDPKLGGMVIAGVRSEGAVRSSGPGFTFPMDILYWRFTADQPVEPPDWRENPALARSAALKIEDFREFPFPERKPLPPPAMAAVCSGLAEDGRTDLIADGFYSTPNRWFSGPARPLGELLTQISLMTDHRWIFADGFVQLRDRRYAASRRGEPTLQLLRRWAGLPREEVYSLDTLAEISAQSYPQYETTVRVLGEIGVLDWAGSSIHSARGDLTFWHALTPAQRQVALSQEGLPYRVLNREQRTMFELASLALLASEGRHSSNQDRSWPPGALEEAVFAVERKDNEMWGIRHSGGASFGGGTREQAFERHKKQNPNLTIDRIERAISTYYRFHYRSPQFRTSGHLNLPLVVSAPPTGERK